MSGYLVDKNVISEYNRKQMPHPGVVKWLNTTPEVSQFIGRILVFDERVASCWANLTASLLEKGRPLPTVDSMIAATALAHDLVLLTRNLRDYAGTGIAGLNPWELP